MHKVNHNDITHRDHEFYELEVVADNSVEKTCWAHCNTCNVDFSLWSVEICDCDINKDHDPVELPNEEVIPCICEGRGICSVCDPAEYAEYTRPLPEAEDIIHRCCGEMSGHNEACINHPNHPDYEPF